MKNNDLNEKQIEQLAKEAVQRVVQRRDEELTNAMKGMSHDDLDELLGRPGTYTKKMAGENNAPEEPQETPKPKNKARLYSFYRIAAACAVLAIILVGIDMLDLGSTSQTSYASLFDNYYKEYKFDPKTFSAGRDRVNAQGYKNTAAVIEEASVLINAKNSQKSLRKGIRKLENLLSKETYKKGLEHEIHWYLGLAYLKDNNKTKARRELKKVIDLDSPTHKQDAKSLLKQI